MRKLIRFFVRHIPRPLLIRFSKLFSFLVRPFYWGNKVECPVCGNTFRKMLPYGSKAGENRLCPVCLSLERHRLMWLYLNDYSDFFKNNFKVLHIAPEQPFLKKFKTAKNLDYTTADMVSPIADLHFDIMKIPLENNIYDWVICNHVLEHVENDIEAMKEILRILKPGGKAILQVPINYNYKETHEDLSITNPKDREKIFGQYDHVRWHGLDYPDRLKKAGFIVENFDIKDYLTSELIEKFRLDAKEILYIAKK
ncbi:MAG: methyltransferase domain-containing protein [Bacteroidales bacterium]|nr:methyltransferase domain-containing protein [Bacteroidales bacterium]MDD3859628.1 methyltransferase domain-containing protein [Bacteroidales bacterium]